MLSSEDEDLPPLEEILTLHPPEDLSPLEEILTLLPHEDLSPLEETLQLHATETREIDDLVDWADLPLWKTWTPAPPKLPHTTCFLTRPIPRLHWL